MREILLTPKLDEDVLVSYHDNWASIHLLESDMSISLSRDDVIELIGFLSEFVEFE